MKNKKCLGQFYTTNSQKIIGNLIKYLPKNKTIIDPFAGNWDILSILNEYQVEGYDIDSSNNKNIQRDTLTFPLNYKNKYVVTNPPYLAKNKNKGINSKLIDINKKLYEKYDLDDLYKISLLTFINGDCEGGIVIIPLNFFCDEKAKIRNMFLSKYLILKLNIFEEQVFDDTTYTVCSFAFKKSKDKILKQEFDVEFFPKHEIKKFYIEEKFGYRLAGEFFSILNKKQKYKVSRIIDGDGVKSGIKLMAIDTGKMNGRIRLEECNETFIDKTKNQTERAFCSFKFDVELTKNEELFLIKSFNDFIEENRKKYNSLFLSNFMNSTEFYARKRISFDLAYKIISLIIENNMENFPSLKHD